MGWLDLPDFSLHYFHFILVLSAQYAATTILKFGADLFSRVCVGICSWCSVTIQYLIQRLIQKALGQKNFWGLWFCALVSGARISSYWRVAWLPFTLLTVSREHTIIQRRVVLYIHYSLFIVLSVACLFVVEPVVAGNHNAILRHPFSYIGILLR